MVRAGTTTLMDCVTGLRSAVPRSGTSRSLGFLAAGLLATAGLAGCSTQSIPSPVAPSTAAGAACDQLATVGTGGDYEYTRYQARPGSTWWVTYAVLSNPCDEPIQLVELQPGGPLSGADAQWTGRAGAATPAHVVTALWVSSTATTPAPVGGREVTPGARVQVIAEVRQGPGTDPHRAPALTLTTRTGHGAQSQLELAPHVVLSPATGS